MILRQSTSQTIRFGPFLDDTDFKTAETGLTIAQADRQVSKDGGAFAQSNHTGNSTHDADGWYSDDLDATDTNTVGELKMQVVVSGALPVWVTYYVVEEAVYDALYGASAAGPLQSTTAGRTLDVTAGGTAGIDWGNVENKTTANDLSGTDIQLCDTVTTNSDMRGTDNAALASVLGALADAAAAGDPTSADTLMQYVKQLVNLLAGSAGIATMPSGANPANGVNLFEMVRAGLGATFDTATDSQEAIRDRGDSSWTTGGGSGLTALASGTAQGGTSSTLQLASGETFADDELNHNIAKITGGTGAGQSRLITDYTGSTDTATVSPNWTTTPDNTSTYEIVEGAAFTERLGAQAKADVNAEADTALTDYDPPTKAEMDSAFTEIKGATWNSPDDTLENIRNEGVARDTAIGVVDTNVDDIESRLGTPSDFGSGTSTIAANLEDMADNGTASYDRSTDSLQAMRDHIGDGTNLTEAGGDGDHLTEAGGTGDHLTAITGDLPVKLTKNVAFTNFMFQIVDVTDGFTGETGKTITATRSIDGAAFSACANSASEVSGGWYKIDLAATDLNGDMIILNFVASDASSRNTSFTIITQPT